jgi:preprotein translocase subunit SecD
MRNPKVLFIFIVILTILSILIVLPKTMKIAFSTKIPLINKSISINRTIKGFDPASLPQPFRINRDLSFRKGLDLEGGTQIVLRADMKNVPAASRDTAMESAKSVIQRRIDSLGVLEPVIQTAKTDNDYRLIVELPGITDINQAVSLVGTTAKLEFRGLKPEASQSAYLTYDKTTDIGLSGSDLESAEVTFSQQTSAPVVSFKIVSDSQKKFYDATQKLVGKQMAICLDQQCFSAPTVQQAIRDNGQISGNFTTEQAKTLATQLNAGALPVPLTILSQSTVGATLGESSLEKSLFAGIIGFLIIVIFMTVLYGRLGMLASVALLLYSLYVLALFKLIPVTLTLAGIAGFILSIGMAVDANILIFERMREELRRGRKRDVAIELGFSRAWTSIRDSNISSIITALILIYFGTGIVRGFAVTLLIGVLVSMFSAIVVTRTFLRLTEEENR